MRRILVTGPNKGIGLAIVEAILSEHDDTFVFLGSRDPGRGEVARRSPAELGMKPPAQGRRSAMFLLFADPAGSGRYYGSDAQRSPLDRYRAPGTPAYAGD